MVHRVFGNKEREAMKKGYCMFVALLAIATAAFGQRNSVLGNINCGSGRATCTELHSGNTGAVRCTCTADCLAPACTIPDVAATRAVEWGVDGPCIFSLTGTATGGTTTTSNAYTQTAVFAKTIVTGAYIGLPRSSQQTADCFNGLVLDEPVIRGLCR